MTAVRCATRAHPACSRTRTFDAFSPGSMSTACTGIRSQRRGREGMLSPFPPYFLFPPTFLSISIYLQAPILLPPFFFPPVHRWCGEEERGCQWTGELGQLGSHLDPNQNQEGCLFVNITCSLCGEAMKRSSLSQHQESDCPKRSYSCPHCHIQTNYDNIVNSHLDECLCYPCPCPHCDLIAERCELHLHIDSECILAPVPCPFQPVGCQGNLLRLELATHTKKSVGNHAQLLLEAGGTSGEHIALYRSSLEEICLENSELSLKVAAFAVQHDADEKRINSRHNIQLALFLVIGVLILVIIALATK